MIEPLIVEVKTELNAFELYQLLSEGREGALLESNLKDEKLGQYSFIGWDPFLTFRYQEGSYLLNEQSFQGEPFQVLKELMAQYAFKNETDFPFVGGAIGYFSYDLVRELYPLENAKEQILDIPACYFNFYDQVIIFDHIKNKVYISALGISGSKDEAVNKVIGLLEAGEGNKTSFSPTQQTLVFHSPFTKETYMETVEKVRQYIKNGDVYIANLTHTFSTQTHQNPFDTYQILRKINPAPFSGMLNFKDFSILSSSPERFLRIRHGKVETRPIKGTRPRGKTPEEDEHNKMELLSSEKDKSELLMIVDLERNDLSKVCKPHSVKVTELFELETYATVYHLVSAVEGQLMDGVSGLDCVKACFPGGSITGAPKLRAMEIIEELEPTRRNVYTGCLGFLGFDGGVDLNIVIRTIVMKDGQAFMGVGGGITWESDCAEEYQETLDKAKALFRSLEGRL